MRELYRGVFVPIMMYAVGSWDDRVNKTDGAKLNRAQRYAFVKMSKAYSTASIEALQVLNATPPLDLIAASEYLKYKITKQGETVVLDEVTIKPGDGKDRIDNKLKTNCMKTWQNRWTESEKGRTTAKFFPNVKKRLSMTWIRPDYYTTQILTGHGNFKSNLKRFTLKEDETCKCGKEETSEHVLWECERYKEDRRELENEI